MSPKQRVTKPPSNTRGPPMRTLNQCGNSREGGGGGGAWPGAFISHNGRLRQSPAVRLCLQPFTDNCVFCSKLVAREGSAPSNAVCKTAMILFHHRAKKMLPESHPYPRRKRATPVLTCVVDGRFSNSPIRESDSRRRSRRRTARG